jgi:hypothetical protein
MLYTTAAFERLLSALRDRGFSTGPLYENYLNSVLMESPARRYAMFKFYGIEQV